MSILDRIFPATKANRAQALEDTTVYGTTSPMYHNYTSYLQAYKLPWVKACVSVIAYNAANVSYKLLRTDVDEDDVEAEILESPVLTLLSKPNPYQTGFDFLELAWIDLELTGNCFWALEEINQLGQPAELYRLNPARVRVLPAKDAPIGGYVYTANSKEITYDVTEMLHLKYANPMSDLYGMGTIEAGEQRFTSDRAMAEHEANFWMNGAKITGVLSTDGTVDDGTFARIRDNIKRFFRSSGFSTLLLENGLKYQSVSDGPAKLGLLELSKMSRDMILAMFGVPPTKVGILENANYKAQNSDEFFWTETIDPKLTRMEKALQRLVDVFHPGENLHLKFDRLNFADDLPMVTVTEAMQKTYTRSVNEMREYQGLDPVPGGDVILMPSNLVPFDQLLPGPDEVANAAADDATMPNLTGTAPDPLALPVTGKAKTSHRAPATAYVIGKHRDAVLRQAQTTHAKALSRFFAEQEARVLAKLPAYKHQKAKLSASSIFDKQAEVQALGQKLKKVHTAAMQSAYGAANTVGVQTAFNLHNPRLEQFAGTLATRVVGITDTTMGDIDAQITEGLRRGYSTDQIATGVDTEAYKGIRGVFSEAKTSRAQTIARTESMTAYNGASTIAYRESGMVDEVELLDGSDDPECAARNGKVVSLDEVQSYLDAEHPNGTLCAIPIVRAA